MNETVPTKPYAVITGASRGIGAEYARALAARGHDLLLVARDRDRLEGLAAGLADRYGIEAGWEALDLAQPDAGHRLYAAARARRPYLDVLVNNAGFGLCGPFVDMPAPRLQDMLRLHVNTVVESVRLFLPGMMERGSGTIITVASTAGLMPVPYLAQYGATKAFLVSFTEALAEEVRGSGVRLQACCPGSTDTDFHATAGYMPKDPVRIDSPAEVVSTSLSALSRGRVTVTVGLRGRLLAALSRWGPRGFLLRATARFMKPRPRPPEGRADQRGR